MPLNDDNLGWNRKRKFIPMRTALGVLDDATSGVPASLGAGTPLFAEALAAAELAGISIAADGDEVYHFLPIPWDMDLTQPMRFRVWFVHNSTDADEPIFTVDYKGIGKQAAISDAKVSADETVTFAAHVCSTTNNSLEVTAWAESNSHKAGRIATTDFGILLALTCTTMSASADEIVPFGLEIQYTVKAMSNPQRNITEGQPTTGTNVND